MKTVDLFGRRLELQGSPYTLLVFREEFGGDLFAHLSHMASKDEVEVEDYTRVVWAMSRTADPKTPGYGDWLASFDADEFGFEEGVGALSVMDSAVMAELFRRREPLRRRVRRWIARRLGVLSRHLGA